MAHFRATGKRTLLDVAVKYADYIDSVFGPTKRHGVPGHEEIELALVKLYQATGQQKYLDSGQVFHRHARQQGAAARSGASTTRTTCRCGSRARSSAMRSGPCICTRGVADVAAYTGDRQLIDAMGRLWQDVAQRKMYITGGIGARCEGEAFGNAYELPNESAYCETCAAIGLALWAHRLNLMHGDAQYADVRGAGRLQRHPLRHQHGRQNISSTSIRWPATASIIASRFSIAPAARRTSCGLCRRCRATSTPPDKDGVLRESLCSRNGKDRPGRQHRHAHARDPVSLGRQGETDGRAEEGRRVRASICASRLVPRAKLAVNGDAGRARWNEKGYALRRQWKPGDVVQLTLPMPVERIEAHPRVQADVGRVAIQRGPIVYCFEAVDNGGRVKDIVWPRDPKFAVEHRKDLLGGVTVITGVARDGRKITAVPYYAWDHHAPGEMIVWVTQEGKSTEAQRRRSGVEGQALPPTGCGFTPLRA